MKIPLLAALPILAHCGEIVWDGRINASTTIDHFDKCTHLPLPTDNTQLRSRVLV